MKRILSLFMSLMVVLSLTAGIDFSSQAADQSYASMQLVNPAYAYTYQTQTQSYSAARAYSLKSSAESPAYSSVDDAADFLRENMVSRVDVITVNYETYDSDYQTVVNSIFNRAMEQEFAKGSADGDYLKLSYGRCDVSIGYSKYSDGRYVYRIEFTVQYYTTAAQEEAVSQEIDRLIAEYDLMNKSDYAKVKTIHDIVCDRVKYDYDNLNNLDYKLQFTAYAALFDGKAVCQGYALLFHRMAKEVGLDTRVVLGENHGWNIVKVDGKYYNVDCTWDDSSWDDPDAADGDYWSSGHVIYNYFMKGSDDFANHERLAEYDTAEFHAKYPMAKTGYVCSHNETVWEHDDGVSCEQGFVRELVCQNCEEVIKTETVPAGEHSYTSVVVPPTANEKGYTEYTCTKCGDKYVDNYTDYASDNSALVAVSEYVSGLQAADYSQQSFDRLMTVYSQYKDLVRESLPQTQIDSAVTDILTALCDLEAYLNFSVTGENGTVTAEINGAVSQSSESSLLFGTEITLTAQPADGYVFDGWYETVTKRIFSYDEIYTFKLTSNTSFEARFVKENSASLIFSNESGQKVLIVDKTPSEWNSVSSIATYLPQVPYKLGFSNGRWVYSNSEVLSQLRNGQDVTVYPQYDDNGYIYPSVPSAQNGEPVLDLYYQLDSQNNVGSFTMAMGLPENCEVESIGIAFYYKTASNFEPDNFILTMNNKLMTAKFDSISPNDIYIVNIRNLSSQYNWCARGYVAYYDENGNLDIAYSNQINIVNRNQVS